VAKIVNRHRGERARDPLADGDEHVELARRRPIGDAAGEVEQLVGRATHRREDGDDTRAAFTRRHQAACDALELLRIRDGGAAELHHDGAEMRRGVVPLDGWNRLVVRGCHADSVGTA
jgi:hypothetical protein